MAGTTKAPPIGEAPVQNMRKRTGWAYVRWALAQPIEDPRRKLVLVALASHAAGEGHPKLPPGELYARQTTIATEAGLRSPRHLKPHLDALAAAGLIECIPGERKPKSKQFGVTHYRMLADLDADPQDVQTSDGSEGSKPQDVQASDGPPDPQTSDGPQDVQTSDGPQDVQTSEKPLEGGTPVPNPTGRTGELPAWLREMIERTGTAPYRSRTVRPRPGTTTKTENPEGGPQDAQTSDGPAAGVRDLYADHPDGYVIAIAMKDPVCGPHLRHDDDDLSSPDCARMLRRMARQFVEYPEQIADFMTAETAAAIREAA